MTSIADSSVTIQTTSDPNFSIPSWFGEVVVISSYLRKHGVLSKINEQVRFPRKRFGRYDVIDFLAVLFGYAISGERTVEEFYARLQPFAIPFTALFERDRSPSSSALSRFLAALTAVLSDVAGFAFVTRGKDYRLLDHPLVQARLHLPPDQVQQRPESQIIRSLYDCPGGI